MRISDWSSDVCSSDLIGNLDLTRSGGREAGVVAAFPVALGDQIMLVTDAGKLIRSPVDDIRIAGRTTRGVTLFRIDESERIVSVAYLPEDEEIGRASCRERVCQYVLISVVPVTLKKTKHNTK